MAKDTTLLVATVKNEGPNILEWVAHHRLCGFDRIQIYQNDSTDTTLPTLRTLDRLGVIEFHNNRHAKGAFQTRAYKRAARSQAFADSDWCMVLDGDEFLNVKTGDGTVQALINDCAGSDAVLVNWRIFGSAGEHEVTGDLVTERFTQSEGSKGIAKSKAPYRALFRTSAFARPDIHGPGEPLRDDCKLVNGSGLSDDAFDHKNRKSNDPGERVLAQVNHYALRDVQSFLMKRARGTANGQDQYVDLGYWQKHDRNEEVDASLANRSFALRAEMKRLDEMSDGKLMQLRQRAIRQWRQTAKMRVRDAEYRDLLEAILSEQKTATMETSFKLPKGKPPLFRSRRSQPLLLDGPGVGWAAE